MKPVTHDPRICEAGPRLLRSCKELLIAVDAAKAVILAHGKDGAGQAWAEAVYAQGIAPGFGYRAEQVIADAEGRIFLATPNGTPLRSVAVGHPSNDAAGENTRAPKSSSSSSHDPDPRD